MRTYPRLTAIPLGVVGRTPLRNHQGAQRTCTRCGRTTAVRDYTRPAVCTDCKFSDPWFDRVVRLGQVAVPEMEE